MLFNSIGFLIFFPIVVTLFYFTKPKHRWIVLLISSYYFYMSWKPGYIFLILLSTILSYFLGLRIDSAPTTRVKKRYLLLGLSINLGILFLYKYFNFTIELIDPFFLKYGILANTPRFKYLLPVGISFYTFQTLSYVIDVYRGDIKPERHLGIFALYVSFFPQLVAGPIERSTNLLPQFHKESKFKYENFTDGFKLMLWGFFLKVVIADRLAILVNNVYNNPTEFYGIQVVVATIFFAYQIFCDFAGYSYIAIGASKVLGIQLMENFNRPYISKSIKEFWTRWHISLSTWFKDYLYIPLGGNRVSKWRWQLNLFIVFLVSGLWHGANLTFVIWGALHGIYIVIGIWLDPLKKKLSQITKINKAPMINDFISVITTFILVSFAWIFFRANTMSDAILLIKNMFVGFTNADGWNELSVKISSLGLDKTNFYIAIVSILIMEIIQITRGNKTIIEFISEKPTFIRWAVYAVFVLGIIFLGEYQVAEFIYFQF